MEMNAHPIQLQGKYTNIKQKHHSLDSSEVSLASSCSLPYSFTRHIVDRSSSASVKTFSILYEFTTSFALAVVRLRLQPVCLLC